MSRGRYIACDADGCTAEFRHPGSGESWWADLAAEAEGWKGDNCPEHAEQPVAAPVLVLQAA